MTELERLARNIAAVLSAEGDTDWRRFMALAREVGGLDADESPDRGPQPSNAAAIPPKTAPDADASFLRVILLGLITATVITGAITTALAARIALAGWPSGVAGP